MLLEEWGLRLSWRLGMMEGGAGRGIGLEEFWRFSVFIGLGI
jgi:hypothetical protein